MPCASGERSREPREENAHAAVEIGVIQADAEGTDHLRHDAAVDRETLSLGVVAAHRGGGLTVDFGDDEQRVMKQVDGFGHRQAAEEIEDRRFVEGVEVLPDASLQVRA